MYGWDAQLEAARRRVEEIENKIDALKYQKSLMAPDDYKKQLTGLLIELAKAVRIEPTPAS